jgi:uncharacterized Zn finger protein (UPF0148 family)
LQPLFDEVSDTGRHAEFTDHTQRPDPPLTPEQQVLAEGLLRAAGGSCNTPAPHSPPVGILSLRERCVTRRRPVMIAFDCRCGEPLAAAPEHAGHRVQCPRCDTRLTVPSVEPESDPPPPARKKPVRAEEAAPPRRKKARLVDRGPAKRPRARDSEDAPPPDPVERMMARAHAELDEDEARRERERGGVHFTPGIIGGAAVFVIFSLLAVVCLLMLLLYPAIGCLCIAMMGLARCVLSFLGRGVD